MIIIADFSLLFTISGHQKIRVSGVAFEVYVCWLDQQQTAIRP
jgi:hypothetical protein